MASTCHPLVGSSDKVRLNSLFQHVFTDNDWRRKVEHFMDTCSRSIWSLARENEDLTEREAQTETKRQTGKPIDRQADRHTN